MKPNHPKKTYLLGDHHGNYDDLFRSIMRKSIRGVRIIHVGDGLEGYPKHWNNETIQKLDNAFESFDIEYLSIRGNHSNPHVFDGSVDKPNFKLLPDYTRKEIDGQTWLFVGGAISLNRSDRQENKNWWPEEEMTLREKLAGPADVLVTHAGPTWLRPPGRNGGLDHYLSVEGMTGWSDYGQNLETELEAELERHNRLFELVQPSQWYLGHYHHSATHQRDGCEIRQLAADELALHHPIHR